MTPAATCSSCGVDAPAGARFCPSCGARLPSDAPGSTERRIITTLFADLVGFTALGERHDPEDVDAVLRAYYEMARHTVERFGGTVEKYIGDAVAGVFGVPASHEDDAERAVRAALEIVAGMASLEGLGGEGMLVRVAVNTGRAVVRLDALPGAGEGSLVGDAVNTAARLLEAAPPMGVVAGEKAYKLTARTILYEELTPAAVKGKSHPVRRWLARGAVARRGIGEDPAALTPMIDREVELGILTGLVDNAIASSSPQFALIVGEAGIGKSRLVLDFFRTLEARSGFLGTWRQGRCPPYGDGLSFWALREIVSAHAGILQTDSPSTVEEKLERALGDGGADPWLLTRLRPLVGLAAPPSEREENFAAWLQFFEGLARARPTVLVIEDVHWASDQTLAFLGYLARHASGAPLLALATARPEFLDAHPNVASYADVVTRLHLKSLTEEESGRLASNLPGAAAVPDIAELVFERSGGNPLFTEELVRYVVEHQTSRSGGELHEAPTSRPRAAVVAAEAPDSITTLIAARLDALPADYRSLLADAAVVGNVFWPGAVKALGGRGTREVERALKELEAREFVRRHGESVFGGDEEFAFWHALTRDVAYEQLPRAARAAKHAATARWIESAVGDREADVAEVLAYHCWTAIQLARSLGQGELAAELRRPALRALKLAGDRALPLDVTAAEEHYRHAAELATSDDEERPGVLVDWGETLLECGQYEKAELTLGSGIDTLTERGDMRAAAVAMTRRSYARWLMGADACSDDNAAAAALLEGDAPSPELVLVLSAWECDKVHCSEYAAGIALADRALDVSSRLGLPEPFDAVVFRGMARCCLGDRGGLEDLRRALRICDERMLTAWSLGTQCNLGDVTALFDGPEAALTIHKNALDQAVRHGNSLAVSYCSEGLFTGRVFAGHWKAALGEADNLDRLLEESRNIWDLRHFRSTLAILHIWRGRVADALELAEWGEATTRPTAQLGPRAASLVALASARWATSDRDGAHEALVACEQLPHSLRGHPDYVLRLAEAARVAVETGDVDLAARMAESVPREPALNAAAIATAHALLAEAQSDEQAEERWATVMSSWDALGVPYEAALARLGRGRCLLALGRAQEAAAALAEAREIFARLRARPALAETDNLLDHIGAGSL